MINIDNIPWLGGALGRFRDAAEAGQLAHAILVHGPAGTGRAALARYAAGELLRIDAHGDDDLATALARHPDYRVLQPPPDKRSISIDQIRELIAFLGLTSHQKGAKVALIEPAEAMTHAAANALLKTLEEPPENTYLLLVGASPARLPATVVSRCRRLRVARPDGQAARAWLEATWPGADWSLLLERAGGAPLAALALAEGEEPTEAFAADLAALRAARQAPAAVARKWARQDRDVYLDWLYRRVAAEIRQQLTGQGSPLLPESRPGPLQKANKSLTMDRSFEVLKELGELRRLSGSGINDELQLTNLLSHWYGA